MLFQSSLRKELARSFGATLVVLITIILTIVLIRTLGLASKGQVNPQDVMLLMAYATIGRLPTILSLSLFIAILSTLSRLYRDSEMVVWFSSGRGLTSFVPPVLRFSWPVLLVIAASALWLLPWTHEKTQELRSRYQQRSDLDRVAPGQFQESSDGTRVFFINRVFPGIQPPRGPLIPKEVIPIWVGLGSLAYAVNALFVLCSSRIGKAAKTGFTLW